MKKEIFIFTIYAVIAFIIIIITPLQVSKYEPQFGITAGTFPLAILYSIAAISCIGIVASILNNKRKTKHGTGEQVNADTEKQEQIEEKYDLRKIISSFVMFIVIVYLIKILGFYISILLLVLAAMYIAGEHIGIKNVLYVLVTLIIIWGFFEKGMQIFLPKGLLL